MRVLTRLYLFCLILCVPALVLAQETSRIEREERLIEKDKVLRERIEKQLPAAPVEQQPETAAPPVSGEQRAFVKKIVVKGVTLIPQNEVDAIVAPFENKDLSLGDMQAIVNRVTDAYRSRGYVTSRGYLPPQKLQQETLEILAVEAVTGDIEVRGNKYFKTPLIRGAIRPRKGEPFNYNELKKSLARLNSHPDRKVKAVLTPGKQPGTTDIILEVNERLPLHVRLDYDNFASRYVGKDRYTATFIDNNLLGFDDILSLEYQMTDRQSYQLYGFRYLFPVTEQLKLGASATRSKLSLEKEFEPLDARGKNRTYSLFAIYDLYSSEELQVAVNTGFDYLDTFNFQLGQEQSRDRLRIARLGLDVDHTDPWGGRTIFSPEAAFGIPDIMGGLEDKDPRASRSGAGGKFIKEAISLLRLQPMPFSSVLFWKNYAQLSPYVLTASEQFQLGGISNVRGYPAGELVGDQGYATTFEWAFPLYFLPKDVKVPFSSATFYDASRIAAFYDWGYVQLHNPQAGEAKDKTLRSAGFGFRFGLPEDFSVRLDFAWALDRTPSDGHHFHPWVAVSKEF